MAVHVWHDTMGTMAEGCVLELDSAFRAARVVSRLARCHSGGAVGVSGASIVTVLRPSPKDLASASRYHPPAALKSLWIELTQQPPPIEGGGARTGDGGSCAHAPEDSWDCLADFVARIAADALLTRYISAVYPLPSPAHWHCSHAVPTAVDGDTGAPGRAAEAAAQHGGRGSGGGCAATELELVTAIAGALRGIGSVRLQVRARCGEKQDALLQRIGHALAAPPHSTRFSPTKYAATLTVIDDRDAGTSPHDHDGGGSGGRLQGHLLYSICPRVVLEPFLDAKRRMQGDSADVCRAAWKLREALDEPEVKVALVPAEGKTTVRAVDLGAAPGGWTTVLAAHCAEVVAVDPAELDRTVLALPPVRHMQVLAMDAVAQLVAEGAGGYDIIVSDMNSGGWGRETAGMIAATAAAGLLRDGAALVLTVKGCEKASAPQLSMQVGEMTASIEGAGFTEVRCVHLIANTAWERTILAVWRA
jgi:23S rRNA U2552 (ribose-2'-O)-methylase RlmE/FtsJ